MYLNKNKCVYLHKLNAMAKLIIKQGDKFGSLEIIKEVERIKLPSGQYNRAFLCKCNCGQQKEIRLSHLIRGRIKSCGLCSRKLDIEYPKLYRVWKSMKERCYLESYIRASRYSKRGIKVCDEWLHSYNKFKDWALKNGYDPILRIDRINNDGDYQPNNCRFVTNKDNCNNREITFRVNYNGEQIPFTTLMNKLSINEKHYPAIRSRIKRGWDHNKAVNTPIKNGNYKTKYAS